MKLSFAVGATGIALLLALELVNILELSWCRFWFKNKWLGQQVKITSTPFSGFAKRTCQRYSSQLRPPSWLLPSPLIPQQLSWDL